MKIDLSSAEEGIKAPFLSLPPLDDAILTLLKGLGNSHLVLRLSPGSSCR